MDNQTIDAYDKCWQEYDKDVTEFWLGFPKSIVETFVNSLPGRRILNLGSGTGRDSLLLRDSGLEVTCFDASSSMLQCTQALGFDSIQGDFLTLELPQKFDGIWAYTSSLTHSKKSDAPTIVKNMYDNLVKNGVLLVGVHEGTMERYETRSTMPQTQRLFTYFTDEELATAMTGFELIYKERFQPSRRAYLNHIYRKKGN